MMRYRKKSMTLIELMIGSAVILIAVLSLWRVHTEAVRFTLRAQEMSIANDDAKDIMERIRNLAFNDITTQFPDGGAVDEDIVGGYTLTNEAIVVSYPQGTGADPLEIAVQISWTGRDSRAYTQTIETLRSSGL